MVIMKHCIERKTINSEEPEEIIVYRSITDLISPKLKSDDSLLFQKLADNVFQQTISPLQKKHNIDDKFFSNFIKTEKLQLNDRLLEKVIEAHEMIFTQAAIALVGESLSGKSTILRFIVHLFQQQLMLNNGKSNDVHIGNEMSSRGLLLHFSFYLIFFSRICERNVSEFKAFVWRLRLRQ